MFDIDLLGMATAASFSPDGRTIVTAISRAAGNKYSGEISLRDPQDGRILRQLPDPPLNPTSVAFSTDGRLIAGGGSQPGSVRIWDAATGQLVRTIGDYEQRTSIAWSPDGVCLAIAGGKLPVPGKPTPPNDVQIWSADGKRLHALAGHPLRIGQVVFSPDAKRLCSIDGRELRLWDVASGQEVLKLELATYAHYSHVAFSPDGSILAASGGPTWSGGNAWRVPVKFSSTQPSAK